MKKFFPALLLGILLLALSGCSFMASVDSPQDFTIETTGRYDVRLYWKPVSGATEYVINTSAKGEKWEPFKINPSLVETVTDKGEPICFLKLESSSLSYDTIYTMTLKAKDSKGIYGAPVKNQFAFTYVDNYNNYLKASRYDDNITITWDNLVYKESSGGKVTYGGPGIRYALFKQEGTITVKSAIKTFVPDEGQEDGVLISKDFIPVDEFKAETFTYIDKDIKAEKSYRYFVVPYNTYNWVSSGTLRIKGYYSNVDWIE